MKDVCLTTKQDTQLSACVEATLEKMSQLPVWSVGNAHMSCGQQNHI